MPRQDGYERVSGHAVYTRDIRLPGMLYAKILTSPYAHAKIVSIDTSQAEALLGVRDILKYNDPDAITQNLTGTDAHYNILTLPGISDFYQHPMGVAVVADSEELCDQALRLVKITWEERPFVLDMEEALKPGAPKIMDGGGTLKSHRPGTQYHHDRTGRYRGRRKRICRSGQNNRIQNHQGDKLAGRRRSHGLRRSMAR